MESLDMRASPKQRVVAAYPLAYSVSYGNGSWMVYQQPAKAVPRGQMAQVVTLGQGETASKAWADAAMRLPCATAVDDASGAKGHRHARP